MPENTGIFGIPRPKYTPTAALEMFGGLEGLKLGDDYRNRILDELLRSVGSLQSQSLNRISPDLPEATKLSMQRGISQGGAEAVQRGVTGAERDIAMSNRDVLLSLLGMQNQRYLAKLAKDDPNLLNTLLGSVGQGAGMLLGGGL